MFQSFKTNFAAAGVLVALAFIGLAIWASAQPQPDPNADLRQQVVALTSAVNELKTPPLVMKEKVVDLPEDGQRWYTVVIYRDKRLTEPADRHLAAMLASTPRLQALAAQTTVTTWDRSDPLYAARYQRFLGGETPAVLVQTHAGKVCYLARGANIPGDGEKLADEVAQAIEQCRPHKPRPNDTPKPGPATPDGQIPDLRPQSPAQEEGQPWGLLAFLLPVLSGLGGAGLAWKKSLA
jgi:hypothetical protein